MSPPRAESESASSLVGIILADRYRITSRIGAGGMGQVYKAEHILMKRQCAIKVLRANLSGDPEAAQRFQREAENASQLSHPNVAQIYDFGEHDGRVYLAMEFIPGESLAALLQREGAIHPDIAADIISQSAAALEAAAILGVSVGLASLVWLPADAPRAPRGSVRALLKHPLFLRLPTLWIGVERFTVGCFVVTFSLYAHHVLGLSDARVGMLFSCFLIPFALATWPMATLATRLDRGWLLGVGAVVYGIAFLLLGVTSAAALPLVLGLAGTASAAIYGPSLCLVASLAPKSLGATAMGLANAAGTLGMLAGTATAGILSAALAARGVERADIYSTLFWIAGGSELVLVALSVPALRAVSRDRAANLTPIAS